MKKNSLFLMYRKALFPAIMTIVSLLLFMVVYWAVTQTTVEPYYLKGLIFIVPFICFAMVLYLALNNKIKIATSYIATGVLIVILGIVMFIAFFNISIDSATTVTTDISRYERALKLSHFPGKLLETFPDKIQDNAKNTKFFYTPAFGQGGKEIALKFETDSYSIKKYISEFSQKAKWVGKVNDSEANKYGVNNGQFSLFEYTYSGLPKDYIIYVIFSESYQKDNWNHGKISLVAINEQNNEIMFLAEDW